MSKALRTAIHQTKPFASLEQEVYLSILVAAHVLQDPWANFLRSQEDLSLSQYNLLRILRGAGEEGLPVGRIAQRMIDRDPDVTRLVDRLLTRGYLARERDEIDRRVVHVTLRPKGADALGRLDEAANEFATPLLGFLGKEQLQELDRLLGLVIEKNPEWP
jgi:DNA-binding MarR family transcriptional regulator